MTTEQAPVGLPRRCLNCDSPLGGEYCAVCGQEDLDRLPPLAPFLADSVRRLMDFDGVVWRSVRRLFTVPGGPAADFIAGRRASTVHPVRAFFLASVLSFGLVVTVPRGRMGMIFALVAGIPSERGGDWAPWIILLVTIPAVAAILHLLLLGRHRRYLEHLVVTLNYFTVALLVAAGETAARTAAGGGDLLLFSLIAVSAPYLLVHGTLVLRRVYHLGALGALSRVVVLATLYFLCIGYLFAEIGRSAPAAS